MHVLFLKSTTLNSNYGQSKKASKQQKNPFAAWATAFGMCVYIREHRLTNKIIRRELKRFGRVKTSKRDKMKALIHGVVNTHHTNVPYYLCFKG